jgi:hypothetical protein
MLTIVLATTLLLQAPAVPAPFAVRVDSTHHEVVITAGPYRVPAMMEGMSHGDMEHMEGLETELRRFDWPVNGWLRGYSIAVQGAGGRVLPRRLLHHLIMANFDRRQLVYAAYERLMGAGQETADVKVPRTIGVPLRAGDKLGAYLMWDNQGSEDIDSVYLVIHMLYTPTNQNPRPVDALPIYLDVNLTVGGDDVFDLPPGRTTKSHDFVLPVGGRLLAAGGHLHDYGRSVRLIDVASGRTLVQLDAVRDAQGEVLDIPRKLFGVRGAGLRLEAGRTYRVVGEYDNTSGALIPDGAMAHIVGIFVPDDLSKWPKLDPNDPSLAADLADLNSLGRPGGANSMAPMNHSRE